MAAFAPAATALRQSYKGLYDSAHKQMGLRYIRDALALGNRNPERTLGLIGQARYHLPIAQEIDRLRRIAA